MFPTAPSEEQILAIHAALIQGCQLELASACAPLGPDCIAFIALPHGTAEAQVTAGSFFEIFREISHFAREEGPAMSGVGNVADSLVRRMPAAEGRMLCIVVAVGCARIHDIPRPHAGPPPADA